MLKRTNRRTFFLIRMVFGWLPVFAINGFLLFLISCSGDDDTKPSDNRGKLCIRVGVEMNIYENRLQMKSTTGTEDFEVLIYKVSGELLYRYERAMDMPSEIELDPGNYYVTASSNNFMTAAFENPYYFGQSETVTVNANEIKTIEVVCTMANCAIAIHYSDDIKQDFTDYFAEVSIAGEKLLFTGDEVRRGYFDLQPISITATLSTVLLNGSEYVKVLNGQIPLPGKGKLYEVGLNASITEGYSAISITLDETMEQQIVTINDNTTIGTGYGDLLITEIMYDPVNLTDTDGEWFEVYNHSTGEINLKDLVIKTSSASHVIGADILLAPDEYYLMTRKEEAAEGTKYVYGTGINLTNTEGMIGIFTYGTDGTDGTEIINVEYGSGNGFPTATGASLSLDPGHFSAAESKAGSSWCPGTDIYNTGDLGSPGLANSSCE